MSTWYERGGGKRVTAAARVAQVSFSSSVGSELGEAPRAVGLGITFRTFGADDGIEVWPRRYGFKCFCEPLRFCHL